VRANGGEFKKIPYGPGLWMFDPTQPFGFPNLSSKGMGEEILVLGVRALSLRRWGNQNPKGGMSKTSGKNKSFFKNIQNS